MKNMYRHLKNNYLHYNQYALPLAIFIIAGLISVILLGNITGVLNNCTYPVDFSIYQQGIYEIAAGKGINPYLTIRDLHILSDHFDPIILLAAPFVKLFNFNPASLMFFEWLWFFTLFVIVYLVKRNEKAELAEIVQIWLWLTFARGILLALAYSIHPTTWSIVPQFLLIYSFYKKSYRGIILSALFLCLFKEIFPIALISVSFYFLIIKKYRTFFTLFLISGPFILFAFYIRPIIWPGTFSYSGQQLNGLLESPLPFLIEKAQNFHYKDFFKQLYPLLIPLFFLFKYEVNKKRDKNFIKHPLFPTLFFFIPLWGIQFIHGKANWQYGALNATPLLALIIFSSVPKKLLNHKFWAVLTIALFVLSGNSRYKSFFRIGILHKDPNCTIDAEKREVTARLIRILTKQTGPHDRIYATPGIIPTVLRPGIPLYQMIGYSKSLPEYNYLLLEPNGTGNLYPVNVATIQKIKDTCSKFANEVIMDNQFYYFAKGRFTRECIHTLNN